MRKLVAFGILGISLGAVSSAIAQPVTFPSTYKANAEERAELVRQIAEKCPGLIESETHQITLVDSRIFNMISHPGLTAEDWRFKFRIDADAARSSNWQTAGFIEFLLAERMDANDYLFALDTFGYKNRAAPICD